MIGIIGKKMIKILKEGKIPNYAIKQFHCLTCGAEFTADARDYSTNLSWDYARLIYSIKCPCCGDNCKIEIEC